MYVCQHHSCLHEKNGLRHTYKSMTGCNSHKQVPHYHPCPEQSAWSLATTHAQSGVHAQLVSDGQTKNVSQRGKGREAYIADMKVAQACLWMLTAKTNTKPRLHITAQQPAVAARQLMTGTAKERR